MRNMAMFLVAAWLLGACAVTPPPDEIAASWHGQTVDNLVFSWGPPAAVSRLQDGRQLVTYTYSGRATYDFRDAPVGSFFLLLGNLGAGYQGHPTPSSQLTGECTVTFRADGSGVIVSHTVVGREGGCNSLFAGKPPSS